MTGSQAATESAVPAGRERQRVRSAPGMGTERWDLMTVLISCGEEAGHRVPCFE